MTAAVSGVPAEAALVEVLTKHSGVNLTVAWEGSPNHKDPRNIRRVCSCGEVIGRLPYPMAKPGRTGTFRLAGDPFDEPHRAHVAREIESALREGIAAEVLNDAADAYEASGLPLRPGWHVRAAANWMRQRAAALTIGVER